MAADRPVARPRPIYLNLFAIRQPVPAIISIMHRASGALLFLAGIPLVLWFMQRTLASPEGFAAAFGPFATPFGKLALLALAWAYIHHFVAGVRHLMLDLHLGIDLPSARRSAAVVLVLSVLLTLIVAVRLW